MVNFKRILTDPFKTIADYISMTDELKRVKTIVTDFEKDLIKQVGLSGGNVKFPDGLLEINPFGAEEGRLNTKYKDAWLDLKSLIESSAVWQTSKEEMVQTLQDIFDANTNHANINQKVIVSKEMKTVKAKVTKLV